MHFELYRDEDGQWRWRLRAINGEPIASGEGYANRADAEHAIDLLRGCTDAPVEVLGE